MNKANIFEIVSNKNIAKDVYEMVIKGYTKAITTPGQFINIALQGKYLRRPISVCDYDSDTVTIIYKVVGTGTKQMSGMKSGESLDVLTGLGNGFNIELGGEKPLLVGGGVGVPPMFNLAKKLIANGKKPTMIMGFNKSDEIFYTDEFARIGCKVYVATADGSTGKKGFVTDVIKSCDIGFDYFYSCGPLPMLKALCEATGDISGQVSFEERMGCGFGVCMGCSCKTKYANKRICKDGPVLLKEEIIW